MKVYVPCHSSTTLNVPLCERDLIVLRVLCLHRLHWVEFSAVLYILHYFYISSFSTTFKCDVEFKMCDFVNWPLPLLLSREETDFYCDIRADFTTCLNEAYR